VSVLTEKILDGAADRPIAERYAPVKVATAPALPAFPSRTVLWTLLAVFVLVSLAMLGFRTLVPPDEGRYAEMAREMWLTGDWITTRLNGIKYFEKPPLQTWMNALSFTAFGLGEWQARLWTGLCGLGGVLLTAHTGKKVFNARVGLYGGLVLGSSLFWVACSQIDSVDMGLSGMMTLALCALLIAQRDDAGAGERRNWMLACWAAMALAVLSKGLIGIVLPGAVLVLYMFAAHDWTLPRRLHSKPGVLLFFAVAAPWFVLVALKNPEQPHFFFIHEHVERFLLKTHHREGPWYYFFTMLIPGIFPWLAFLPQSLARVLRPQTPAQGQLLWQALSDPASPPQGELRASAAILRPPFRPDLLLLIWAVFIFCFFSYSSSKLPGYILPIFPAVALLIARHLEVAPRRATMLGAGMLSAIGAGLLVFLPWIMQRASRRPAEADLLQAYQPWVVAAAMVALAGGALVFWLARREDADGTRGAQAAWQDARIIALACAGFLATQLIIAGFEPYGYHRAARALVPAIRAELAAGTKLYSVGMYEQSLTFYLQRKMILVAYQDEFEFGLQQQPELGLATVEEFVNQWQRDASAGVRDVALIHPDIYAALSRGGVRMRIVAQDSRRIVVANR
jgi:4-amino-4-deoxy-L-arabinose transferase-like glycosyltransferase